MFATAGMLCAGSGVASAAELVVVGSFQHARGWRSGIGLEVHRHKLPGNDWLEVSGPSVAEPGRIWPPHGRVKPSRACT